MQLPDMPGADTRRKVLFLCTGNTCRSPMAEGLFQMRLEAAGLAEQWAAISAGLGAFDGELANEKAVAVLKKQGIDLTKHRSQRMNLQLLGESELFVCMEPRHVEAMARFVEQPERLMLLGDGIADPYGGDEAVYEQCAQQIMEALDAVLKKIRLENSAPQEDSGAQEEA